jgi:hypothetical protein
MDDVEKLLQSIENEIGGWAAWPGGWPEDADIALIDAVFSARTKYEAVVRPLGPTLQGLGRPNAWS